MSLSPSVRMQSATDGWCQDYPSSHGCRHPVRLGPLRFPPRANRLSLPVYFSQYGTLFVSSSQDEVGMVNKGVGSNSSLSWEQKCSSRHWERGIAACAETRTHTAASMAKRFILALTNRLSPLGHQSLPMTCGGHMSFSSQFPAFLCHKALPGFIWGSAPFFSIAKRIHGNGRRQ